MAVGRISGPLLKSNLLRDGVNLAFENDLLYLEVSDVSNPANHKIGIKTTTPQYELDVNGTINTTESIVDNSAIIGDITVTGNTISTSAPYLNLATFDSVVYQNKLRIDSIDIEGNVISTNESNANLELRPNGTGIVQVNSDMNVFGNIHATGNITADGSITLGDADTDNVVFAAEVASDLIPDLDDTYSLGSDPSSGGKQWNDLWVQNIIAGSINSTDFVLQGVDLTTRPGNMFYVSVNGDDTSTGSHPQDPVLTLGQALSLATAGDTIHIFPGEYQEAFPLTVPQGVTVKGENIRGVKIRPTTDTRYNDAFLLNGETTIEDLTVTGFYSGGNFYETTAASAGSATINVGPAPFAHTYISGGTISISGTDYTVTNATYNHTTGNVLITHTGPDAGIGQQIFIKDLVFSCNGGTRVFPDNGYAFRFATDFEVTTRSPYIRNITVITQGSNANPLDASDPRGFNDGDAGKGAYVDGAYATANSREAGMLFHSVTFITPGVDTLTATNGARIEWLNCFTYFANRGLYAFDSNDGLAGAGKTRIRLSGITGTFAPGDTVTFSSTDASTVATLTIDSVDGNIILVDGKDTQLVGFDTTPASITAAPSGASATTIENLDLVDFGAEIRMIGSANVYGNYGLYGDGAGVIVYAIGQNLAYIGNGKEVTNDPTTVIQANEVVELNDAKVRYNSVDHRGDFRVGDLFYVNQETGSASFNVDEFNIDTTNGVNITTGGQTTFLDGTRIDTGNIRLSGNTVSNISGTNNLKIDSASGLIEFRDNVNVQGNLSVDGNLTLTGNLTIGDEATDTIQIVAGIDSDLIPNLTSTYNLGSTTKTWRNLYINESYIDDILITNNYITTTVSNANLELRANGTGEILVPTNDVNVSTGLNVTGTTTLNNTSVTGSLLQTGDVTINGDTTVTGNISATNYLNVSGSAQFEGILIDDNFITTTVSNSDLELRAAGSGRIVVNTNDVQIDNNLNISGTSILSVVNASGTITANSLQTTGVDNLRVSGNIIETTTIDSDLILQANGTGEILVPNNNVEITNNLTVTGTTTLNNTTVTGTVTHLGDYIQTGNTSITGNISATGTLTINSAAQLEEILIEDNFITTTTSNTDLELRANGTGEVVIQENAIITNDLTVLGTITAPTLTTTGTITADSFSTGDILIDNNVITTTLSNSNLELVAAGTGEVLVPINDVTLGQDLTVNGTTTLANTQIAGDTTVTGNISVTGNYTISNSVIASGNLTVNGQAQLENILINDNYITTTQSNSDLELRANGTGEVLIPSNDVTITNNLTVGNTATFANMVATGTITADSVSTGDIVLIDNVITTTLSNSDLELVAAGTGEILVPNNNVTFGQDLAVAGTSTLADTVVNGDLSVTGNVTQNGNYILSGNITAAGNLTVGGQAQLEDILINDNYITTTLSNSDLELRANGTGAVIVPTNDVVITNDLNVNGTATFSNINATGTITADSFSTGDILIDNNVITTTLSNSNLELVAAGTGAVVVPINDVTFGQNLTVSGTTNLSNTDVTGTLNVTGNVTQTGDATYTGTLNVSQDVVVNGQAQLEDILINDNYITTTLSNSNLELRANGTGDILIPNNNVRLLQDLTILGTASFTSLSATGTITADSFSTGDILIDNNVITTTLSNSNLELVAAGTGEVLIPNNNLNLGQDLTVVGNSTLADISIVGNLTQTGATTQVGDYDLTGNITVTGILDVDAAAQFEDIRISGNVIQTTQSNSNLELVADGSGVISIPSNDLEVTGNLVVGGTLSLSQLTVNNSIISPVFDDGDITISGNVIRTNLSNSDLELRANGTGTVSIPTSDVEIANDLTVSGTTTLADTVITGTVTHTGDYNQTGNSTISENVTVGQNLDVTGSARFEEILIDDNYITTTTSNADLELRANGTGVVRIPNNNVIITNDLTITGDLFANDLTNLGVVSANSYSTGDILIDDNYITTTLSNSNLELRANGTGSIIIGDLDFNGTTISSATDITLESTAGDIIISGNGALKIPVGNTAQQPAGTAGQIRYNSQLSRFEGFNGANWITLQGVEDVDGDTRITPELTEGANDNIIRFYAGGNLVADVDNTRFRVDNLSLPNIDINNNTIQPTAVDTDLTLSGNGTGDVVIENFRFEGGTITNTVADAVTTFNSTGNGYFKIPGTGGFVLPVGNNLQKPTGLSAESGMIRYNNSDGRVELYNGTSWVGIAGTSGGISIIDAENIAIEYVIVLG